MRRTIIHAFIVGLMITLSIIYVGNQMTETLATRITVADMLNTIHQNGGTIPMKIFEEN